MKAGFVLALLFVEVVVCCGAALASAETPPMPPLPFGDGYLNINADKAYEMLTEAPSEVILLDVRTKSEHDAEHILMEGVESLNIPLSDLEQMSEKELEEKLNKSKAIIVYCRSGSRSRQACKFLSQYDYVLYNLQGGINAWKSAGYPTTAFTPSPSVKPTPTATPTSAQPTQPTHPTQPPTQAPSPTAPLPTETPPTPASPPTAETPTTPTTPPTTAETPTASPTPGFEIAIALLTSLATAVWLRGNKKH